MSGKKIVVMHVVEALGGGVGQAILSICQGVGENVQSIVVHGARDFDKNLKDNLRNTTFIKFDIVREINIQDLFSGFRLFQIIRKHNPDVVHLHSSKAGAIGRLVCLLGRKRVLYTPHSYSFLRKDIGFGARVVYKFIEKILSRIGTTVACGMEEYAVSRTLSRDSVLILNSVDLSIFNPRNREYVEGVMSVGRICPQKDFKFFCELAILMPDVNFKWVSGDVGFMEAVPNNVTVYGKLTQSELSILMSKTAVYINTSLWEGLSKAVIEACAVGMPLILRNVTGNRDLLYIGADARMFDIMSEAVKLIRQSLSVESISRSCVVNTEIAKKFFSPNAHLYESLYQANAIKF